MKKHYQYLLKQGVKKKRRRRALVSLLITTLIGSVFFYMFTTYSSLMEIYSGFNRDKSKLRVGDVHIAKEPFSVLIMGIEEYATDNQNGRTDTLIYSIINPKTKKVSLMSIPRDSLVTISERNTKNKINAAHAYGGEKMAIETVEDFLQVPVDHYVKINFDGFKKIVDSVDGITVDVPFDFKERSDIDYYKLIEFKQGQQMLNGEEALAYVRMRKDDPKGDHGRADRQRQVITAVAHKLNSTSTVFKIKDLSEIMAKHIKTSIPVSAGISLYKNFSGFNPSDIQTIHLEGEDKKINNIYYFIPDEKELQNIRTTLLKNLGQEELDLNSTKTNVNI
ncbi:LytR family transcriptional regulator [Bacillus cereus]|nr:LCP family protein [Bacillus cereus]PFA64060.1 LytR family transcriptional regulator [Bacillus cereus]